MLSIKKLTTKIEHKGNLVSNHIYKGNVKRMRDLNLMILAKKGEEEERERNALTVSTTFTFLFFLRELGLLIFTYATNIQK